MEIVLFITYCILINIYESLEEKLNSLKSVDSCPMNEQAWRQKSVDFSCSEAMTYHCIFAKNGSMYELCMNTKNITNIVGCPQINFYEDEILFDSTYSECPTKHKDCPKGNETYKTDSLYKFPACLQKVSIRTYFRDKGANGIGSTSPKENEKGETNNTVALFVIIAVLGCIVIIVLLWAKRKDLGCLQRCRRITMVFGNADDRQVSSISKQEEQLELETFIPKGDEGNDEARISQHTDEGQTECLKLGAIFDWTFRLKTSHKLMKIIKDGREILAGKRFVMSDTKEGYRLIIFQLTREDEGEYTCINTSTKETDIVHLKIEKATRAIYHHECIKSLSSIPHILFFLQQAMRQASHADETMEIRSSLNNIKKETFQVLTLSYQNITKIHMLSRKTMAAHLNGISEALKSHRTAEISEKVSRMARDIQEGQKIVEETLVAVEKVMNLIDSAEAKLTNLPSLSEDMSSCHVSLQNLFVKWNAYKLFFSSVNFVIMEGRSLTGEQDGNALTPNDPKILRIYVASVGFSTQYYAEIYLDLIQELVDKFYIDEPLEKDNIDRLSQIIKDRYDEMYERDSRAGEQRVIQYEERDKIQEEVE